MDLILLASLIAFFSLTAGYVAFCDHLMDHEPSGEARQETRNG